MDSVTATVVTFTKWQIRTIGRDQTVLYGTGIKAEPWQPITGGTINSIAMHKNDNLLCSISGISVSAPKYFTWKHKSNLEIPQTFFARGDTMHGSSSGDTLSGFTGSDRIFGETGSDKLIGGSGNDLLNGGMGKDTLTGGSGEDGFALDIEPVPSKFDRITDFTRGEDLIRLHRSAFKEIGAKGELARSAFWSGTKAHDSTDRIVYNKKTGALHFDPDGSGPLSKVTFAILDKGFSLKATDFLVV
ncbi:calcium-binding protein [Microvirga roseola]|uniref:calcium-binding protein n=1 Tax=Microvirga roseola TaxID=2883126 RepID=UPI0022A841BC|nr:calcium-binding protein [Microvirga roseola]